MYEGKKEMTAQLLIEKLDELIEAHKELLMLSKEKTDAIKKPDLKPFAAIVAKEKRLINLVNGLEKERAELVRTFLGGREGTVTDCLAKMTSHEKVQLTKASSRLRELVEELKEQNELNRLLIQQSLQFVNMNISLFLPEEDTYTYERPKQTQESKAGRSLFDTRA